MGKSSQHNHAVWFEVYGFVCVRLVGEQRWAVNWPRVLTVVRGVEGLLVCFIA